MDDDGVIRLRRVIVRLARQLNASAAGESLTQSQSQSQSQASVLGLVVGHGPLSLTDLASLAGINPTMLSRVVGRLDARNLINRNPGQSDVRTVSVTATTAGIQVLQRIQQQQTAAVSPHLGHLDRSQEAVLLEALPLLEGLAGRLGRAAPAAGLRQSACTDTTTGPRPAMSPAAQTRRPAPTSPRHPGRG
jgi:DNA-binding MarR family transcriptional regulator